MQDRHADPAPQPPARGWGGARRGAGGRRGPGPATIRRHRFIVEWVMTNCAENAIEMLDEFDRMTDRAVYTRMSLFLLFDDPLASGEMARAAMNIPKKSQSRGMLDRTARFLDAREKRRCTKETKRNPAKALSRSKTLETPADRSSRVAST